MSTHKSDLSALSISQLEQLTGRTYRTIKKLLAGIRTVREDGRTLYYDPKEALPAIYEISGPIEEAQKKLDLSQEKARLASHQANKVEIEVALLRKKVLRIEDVEAVWGAMLANIRAKILSLPTKAAPVVLSASEINECQRILKEFCYEALLELSDFDPEQFGAPAGDKGDEEARSSPGLNSESVGGPGEEA